MRLNEALQHRWAGREIRRKSWGDKTTSEPVNLWLSDKDIDADDWEVVPKYVAWPEAWEALREGKKIKINGEGPYLLSYPSLVRNKTTGADQGVIPVWWLNSYEIEILED